MRDKPNIIHLSSFFLKEGDDHREAKEQIAKSWRHIHKTSRKDLAPRRVTTYFSQDAIGKGRLEE